MQGVTKLYIIAAAVLASLLAGFAGAWQVQDWRYGAKEAQRMEVAAEKRRMDAKQIQTAATGYEADKTAIRTEFITITETVERIVREPFYAPDAPACLDADGLRELRSAIDSTAAGVAAPAVPGSSSAR